MIANLPDILALVESGWRNARVLVIGDVMLDRYIWGEVERISPEAPVPVVRATWQNERPGGAANVAMNLAALGACVTVAGFGGGDGEQGRVESMLADAGIEPALTEVATIPTTTKLRIFSGNESHPASNCNKCSASWQSVFCFRTRLARISAVSPIHSSKFSFASKCSCVRSGAWGKYKFCENGAPILRSNRKAPGDSFSPSVLRPNTYCGHFKIEGDVSGAMISMHPFMAIGT